MTPEQREAAINMMSLAFWGEQEGDESMERALDALTEEFLLLHRDDVHIERCQHESTVGAPPIARLVTRWESITKEDNDA